MLTERVPEDENVPETISEIDRLIGGVRHAFTSGEILFDEAMARIKLITELYGSDHPTEDK